MTVKNTRYGVPTAALALSLLVACASVPETPPDPGLHADICGVLSIYAAPGVTDTTGPALGRAAPVDDTVDRQITDVVREVEETGHYVGLGSSKRSAYGTWGRCPANGALALNRPYVDALLFNTDRSKALTRGGWQAAPMAGGYGWCTFRKDAGKWSLIGCQIGLVS